MDSINVKVEGVNWVRTEVAKFESCDAFVAYHMADASTYRKLKPERKEKALKLAYTISVPEAVEVSAVVDEPVYTEPAEVEKPKKVKKKQEEPLDGE